MKHAIPSPSRQSIPRVNVPQKQTKAGTKPAADVEAVINDIHHRADYVGPVLEKILQAGHEGSKYN